MGMLQLAGAVSGFGKGMGQGLQTMQATMSQQMLMEERNKFDLARLRETFGHERGLMQERLAGDIARDDKRYARDLDLEESRQDFQARQERIQREEARQKEGRDADRTLAAEDRKLQNRIQELVVTEGLSRDAAAQQARLEVEKERRAEQAEIRKESRAEKRGEKAFQRETGRDIVIERIKGENRAAGGGTTKADYHDQDSKVKAIESTLKLRLAELDSINLSEKREAEIRREIRDLEKERNELLGIKGGYRERPPIRMPQ